MYKVELSSWLERIADIYLVTPDELQNHVGWARPALQLEREPVQKDLECIAVATSSSVERLRAMTFHDAPPRYRSLLLSDTRSFCPDCSPGMQRPQRLRAWSFAFSFRCERHRQPLFGGDMRGIGAIGEERVAHRGVEILERWAMGQDSGAVPVARILSLLLAPVRKPSPAAPWELARLPLSLQHEFTFRAQCFRRPALKVVVPGFFSTVPIYDQQLPSDIRDLSGAPGAERYALAIGVACVVDNPIDAVFRILEASDEFGRKKITALLERWPAAIRSAIGRRPSGSRKGGEGRRAGKNSRFNPSKVRARSGRDHGHDRADV